MGCGGPVDRDWGQNGSRSATLVVWQSGLLEFSTKATSLGS